MPSSSMGSMPPLLQAGLPVADHELLAIWERRKAIAFVGILRNAVEPSVTDCVVSYDRANEPAFRHDTVRQTRGRIANQALK